MSRFKALLRQYQESTKELLEIEVGQQAVLHTAACYQSPSRSSYPQRGLYVRLGRCCRRRSAFLANAL